MRPKPPPRPKQREPLAPFRKLSKVKLLIPKGMPAALIAVGVFVACGGSNCSFAAAQALPGKPNIIVILADDFGYECVGANGGQSYRTPNLDKLAAQGARFTRCHVTPLCTPTRVMLMTGMSSVRNYTDFGSLDTSQTTFGNIMKEAAYATCMVGKWQLGRQANLPRHFGFDEHCLWQLTRRPDRYKNPGLEVNGKERNYRSGEYGPDIVNDYALDFISRHTNRPFFLYYTMMLTHAPFQPTPDSPRYAEFDNSGERSKPEYFADMVTYMDKLIGKLTLHLDTLGLRTNTMIFFLGDNGTGRGITSRLSGAPYHGGKGQTTMRGTHVPAIAQWSGAISSGLVCDDLIDASDILPTFCELAEVKIPEKLKLDGRSFAPQLRGERGRPREWLYTWYQPYRDRGKRAEYAFDKRFKLYSTGEFFDIANDPDEQEAIARWDEDAKAVKAKLQNVIDSYQDAQLRRGDGPPPKNTVRKRSRR